MTNNNEGAKMTKTLTPTEMAANSIAAWKRSQATAVGEERRRARHDEWVWNNRLAKVLGSPSRASEFIIAELERTGW